MRCQPSSAIYTHNLIATTSRFQYLRYRCKSKVVLCILQAKINHKACENEKNCRIVCNGEQNNPYLCRGINRLPYELITDDAVIMTDEKN